MQSSQSCSKLLVTFKQHMHIYHKTHLLLGAQVAHMLHADMELGFLEQRTNQVSAPY